jgi:hypothetical protein
MIDDFDESKKYGHDMTVSQMFICVFSTVCIVTSIGYAVFNSESCGYISVGTLIMLLKSKL